MTLYGVGMGPGDPELVTVRGRERVETADRVFAPGRMAERLGSPYAETIERLEFPMTEDEAALEAAWAEAAATVAPAAKKGAVAFLTVGDPTVYSTFRSLEAALNDYPAVEIETIPGVSVVTAFATALGVTIEDHALEVREARAGMPEHDPDQLLLLKVLDVPDLHETMRERGYEVTYGRRLFWENAMVTQDPTDLDDRDYFTIAFAERTDTEGEP